MAEMQMLLSEEIPNARKALIDSHNNLQKVASYCEQRYLDEPNKKIALEETKNYTTQSLASVAYQINTLASNMLQMLDIQAAQLASMDSSINNIAQTVDIHKEKVARREIGLLTTSKVVERSHQIVAPTNPDRSVKYVRKPVDYTELDDIGHGVKVSGQSNTGTARRPSGTNVKQSPNPSTDGSSKRDSLQGNSSYGTLRAVKAPTVPQDYTQINRRMPNMHRGRTISNSSSESGSHSSSVGYGYGLGGFPPDPGMPAPSSGGVPPPSIPTHPPIGAGMPPPPPTFSTKMHAPPPPAFSTKMHAPPPPTLSPKMPAPPPPVLPLGPASMDSSGGYSTPHVGYDGRPPSLGGTAETYAATSVMDLPPPPPSNILSSYSSSPKSSNLRSLDDIKIRTSVPFHDAGIPPPPSSLPVGLNILPPPPPPMSSGGESSLEGFSMEPDWAPKTYLEKMVVIYDYSAENADELNLKEDQLVYVVKKNDDGWYEGVLDGVTGLFPGNYAESISI